MAEDPVKQFLVCVVSDMLGLNLLPASQLQKRNRDKFIETDFAVISFQKRSDYYDVKIWNDIKKYMYNVRPKCDTRLRISEFGEIIPLRKAGRRRMYDPRTRKISFSVNARETELLDRISGTGERSSICRNAMLRFVYLEYLMWEHKDPTLHTRPIGSGWGLYRGNGDCVATGKDEVAMLLKEMPYRTLLSA